MFFSKFIDFIKTVSLLILVVKVVTLAVTPSTVCVVFVPLSFAIWDLRLELFIVELLFFGVFIMITPLPFSVLFMKLESPNATTVLFVWVVWLIKDQLLG